MNKLASYKLKARQKILLVMLEMFDTFSNENLFGNVSIKFYETGFYVFTAKIQFVYRQTENETL